MHALVTYSSCATIPNGTLFIFSPWEGHITFLCFLFLDVYTLNLNSFHMHFFLPLTLYLNFNLLFTYISISPSSNSFSFHFNHFLVRIKIIIHENRFAFNYTTITFLMIGVIIFTFLRHGELCISLSFVSIITSFTTWEV